MSEFAQVHYEDLSASYLRNLNTVLRNFQAGGHDFLETWVPDEDVERSVLGVVEAAMDSGLPGVSVFLGNQTLASLDLADLERHAKELGRTEVETRNDGVTLTLSFLDTAGARLKTSEGAGFSDLPGSHEVEAPTASSEVSSTPSPVFELLPSDGVRSIYRAGLLAAADEILHEGPLELAEGRILVSHTAEGVILQVLADPSRNYAVKASFQGATSPLTKGLLETLCRLMENRPFIECHDHVVIFLEHALRDHSAPAPVPGIITPENADPIFSLPNTLVRGAFKDYCQQTGFSNFRNQYDRPVADAWKALTPEERVEKIQAVLDGHEAGAETTVLRMESPKRVIVAFSENVAQSEKQHRLMVIEDFLQRSVESTLHLYVEPKVDQNRRRLKEASAI